MLPLKFRIFIFTAVLFALGGCQTIDIRGQYVEDQYIKQLETKRLTKIEVIDLIGTPTVIPDYSPNTFYYIQRSLARRIWLAPKVVEQRIVKITFSKKDIVEDVLVLNDSHHEEIRVISDYTRTYGTELNGLQKFVRNIGRFGSTKESKKNRNK